MPTEVPAVERMRALVRDSYRCQRRDRRGRPCLKPTAHVVYTEKGDTLTACREVPHP